jgi:MOSC domain-containing protein YiiM
VKSRVTSIASFQIFFTRRKVPPASCERNLCQRRFGQLLNSCNSFFTPLYVQIDSDYASSVVAIDFELLHLFVSVGHNYLGHHGKLPGNYAPVELEEIECIAGKGITGDRYFGHKEGYKGQITFFEEEAYQDLCLQFGVWDRGPEVFRRNAITRGIRLNELIGVEFELQGVRFFGTEECRPCYWMNTAFADGAEKAMRGRGGLRAEIRSDGFLRRSA